MGAPADSVLIEKAKSGDTAALKLLIAGHEGRVAGVVRTILGTTPEADDLGQEVFIRFYDGLQKFRDSSPGKYLTRMAAHLSLNVLKRGKRSPGNIASIEQTVYAGSSGDKMDFKERLNYALSQLDPESKLVVTLRLVEGYTTEETADLLDIPVQIALSRLALAQQKLRNLVFAKIDMSQEVLSDREELLLKSCDAVVSNDERIRLGIWIQEDPTLRKFNDHCLQIRDQLKRPGPDTFGPFFAERILHVITQRSASMEYQVFFFAKKYQLLVAGVVVALLIGNLLLSEELTWASLFGLEEDTTEDVYLIDLYENLAP